MAQHQFWHHPVPSVNDPGTLPNAQNGRRARGRLARSPSSQIGRYGLDWNPKANKPGGSLGLVFFVEIDLHGVRAKKQAQVQKDRQQ